MHRPLTAAIIGLGVAGLLIYSELKQSQLKVSLDYYQQGYYAPVTIALTVSISGGQAPYTVTVNFGDGTSSTQTTSSTSVVVTHTYSNPGSYTPSVSVKDNVGQTATASAPTLNVISPTVIPKLSITATYSVSSQGSSYIIGSPISPTPI